MVGCKPTDRHTEVVEMRSFNRNVSVDSEEILFPDNPVPMRKKLLLSKLAHTSKTRLLPKVGLRNMASCNGKDRINVSIIMCPVSGKYIPGRKIICKNKEL